jgi:hypothetical protein
MTFGAKKKWSYKSGDLLKEVQFICNFKMFREKVNMDFYFVGITF